MREISIQRKLQGMIMLTSTIVLLLACAAFVVVDLASARHMLNRDLLSLAEIISANSTAPLTFGDSEAASEVLQALEAKPSIIGAAIFASSGPPVATYGATNQMQGSSLFGSLNRIEIAREIVLDGETIGTVYIASDLRDSFTELRRQGALAVGILLASLLMAYLLASRLQRLISQPILELATAAAKVRSQKDYSIRVLLPDSKAAAHELTELVTGFNQMLNEIEHRDEELSRHRDDLEHQVDVRTAELRSTNTKLADAKVIAESVAELNADLSRQREMILDAAGEGIMGIDGAGIVTFINTTGAQIVGRPVEQIVGVPLHASLHPKDVESVDCPMCETRSTGNRPVQTTYSLCLDSSTIPIEYIATPMIESEGWRSGGVVMFRDITERLAIERMKDEFVSTVSHELRTPLTSIRGALGLLGSGLIGTVGERAKRMLEIAISNTDRLVRLINDILDLERIESGKVELNKTTVNAAEVMEEAVLVVQSMADAAGVSISLEKVDATASLDRDRIVQTLTNLLGNAIKFSPPGTTVRLSGSVDRRNFTFRITDEGRGVPADQLDNIFERFKQVDASDSRDKGGSGLGLPICRSIVAAHGGRIWAESVEGQGSAFCFTLPMPTGMTAPRESIKTVVIWAQNREMNPISERLQERGFTPVIIESLSDLMETVLTRKPDAVVLDLLGASDPRWRFLEALKKNAETENVPIIVASSQPESLLPRYVDLIARWIPSPLNERKLVDAVYTVSATSSVLVIEDDLDLARVITAGLQARGIHTVHSMTGKEAIEACQREVPMLVVLDLVLPELDGFEVVEWMRTKRALSSVPLLVFSAREVSGSEQERLRLGPTDFLIKSRVSLDEFADTVMKLLGTVSPGREIRHAS